MTATIIDGRVIAAELRVNLAGEVSELASTGVTPGLAVVLVGDDPGSVSYVTAKAAACAEIGIFSKTIRLPATISQQELLERIAALNADNRFHAILQQLPLSEHLDERAVLDAIEPAKDVDGLHPSNLGRLLLGETSGPIPCTPKGVMHLIARSGIDPAGAHAVVVGRSSLVGRPLAVLLANKASGANATVTLCHTGTTDLAAHTRTADILVVAAGCPNTVTGDMVKPGATVIDVGTNRIDDASRKRGWRLIGDVDFDSVADVAGNITKVPGGVGPMTIAMLLENTVRAARLANLR
ncbi:MAG: bifunctional 5,10-methylene-tetrahydrofolate dehydrogenase/5,10-methylene-tetrahydrofolate cyclohydrolase [Dehalococcoidia bacterium]|nr:bifunctional 5,10-methylene-tetrahydrofolate dehydrogenase/5,10-methylene-tetrahydrofolate cyclohydrolase [Dehalococcoidia bacterium]HCV00528.1 bifunctional 5,10-methylene-tetrahydrofolate dehydrogenase/5,10-methylene-tetrahydrofolate cyclohydrolase [Dehalococcoidia bacterium]|tara:strand:+ start:499 stop:1386 length:888 start_codon:yes stop_codon:yes gene_type:complete